MIERAPSGDRFFPALTGVLLALSYPPVTLLLPPFVALVPLLLHIERLPGGTPGRWSAIRAGLVAGGVQFGILLYWILTALLRHSLLALPAYLLTVAVLSLLVAGFTWAVHYTRSLPVPFPLQVAVYWTAMEWIQGHLGDFAFPWLGLGTALAPYPLLAGAADIVGARGLSLLVALVNGLLALALLRRPGTVRAATAAVGLVLAMAGYGAWRNAALETRPAADVAVVQPDIPEEIKTGDRDVALDSSLAALSALTRSLPADRLDLVAWPEVALPVIPTPALVDSVTAMAGAVGAPILAGAYGAAARGDGAYNSAFLVTASGRVGTRYDKRRLVPFVERIPYMGRAPGGRAGREPSRTRFYGDLTPGIGSPLLDTAAGSSFGVLICFESAFHGLSRRYRRAGADFLVNITNDAWFGGREWYERTPALHQHPSHLVLRAIENRMGIVRAANTGISMFVDPTGRTHDRTALFEPAARVATVRTTESVTLYVRWGDWLATAATLAAIALLAGARLGRRGTGRA